MPGRYFHCFTALMAAPSKSLPASGGAIESPPAQKSRRGSPVRIAVRERRDRCVGPHRGDVAIVGMTAPGGPNWTPGAGFAFLFERLRVGSIVGLLIAGAAIGPWGAGLFHDVATISVLDLF